MTHRMIAAITRVAVCAAVTGCFSGRAQTWDTIFSVSGNLRQGSLLLDPFSQEWAPPHVFIGTLGTPGNRDSLIVVDRTTGSAQRIAAFANLRDARLGFDPISRTLFAQSTSTNGGWEVRKSMDGFTWSLVDAYAPPGTNEVILNNSGFASDDNGNVFIAGDLYNSQTRTNGWIIRRSTDRGETWSTVENVKNAVCQALHFVAGPKGGLFAVGTGINGTGGGMTYSWLIRRSRDAGSTWTTVHSYTTGNGANAITSDAQGTIYVGGGATAITLKSSKDGGNTWQTVDVLNRTVVEAMAVDSAGNLYAAGYGYDGFSFVGRSVIRRNPAGIWEDLGPTEGVRFFAIERSGNVLRLETAATGDPESPRIINLQQLTVEPIAFPPLQITRSDQTLQISWPNSVSASQLESKDVIDGPQAWAPVTQSPETQGDRSVLNVDSAKALSFFRLRKL